MRKQTFVPLIVWLILLLSGSIGCDRELSDKGIAARNQDVTGICPGCKLPELTVKGNTYYVNSSDPKASDENDGLSPNHVPKSQSGPWQTIQKAATIMTAGDATYIRAGIYHESDIRFRHSGKEGAPIILSAYGFPGSPEEVIIDGTESRGSNGINLVEGRSNIVIQGLIVQNMSGVGIASDENTPTHYQNIMIHDVHLRNNRMGLRLSAVDNFKLKRIQAYNNDEQGMTIQDSGSKDLFARNGYVAESEVYNNGNHGMTINQGSSITVCHCKFYGNRGHGFRVVTNLTPGFTHRGGHGKTSNNIILEYCESYKNAENGFVLHAGSQSCTFADNKAFENRKVGFALVSGSKNLIMNNTAHDNTDQGFALQSSSDNVLINNLAYNNSVNGFSVVERSSNNLLVNNTSHGNGRRGFLINGQSTSNTLTRNLAYQNHILGYGMYESTKNVLKNNVAHTNVYHGFVLLFNADNNLIVNNKSHSNSVCGFYFESSTANTLKNNTAYDNSMDGFTLFHESQNNVLSNNVAYGNARRGYFTDLTSVHRDLANSNTAYDNAVGGYASIERGSIEDLPSYTKPE